MGSAIEMKTLIFFGSVFGLCVGLIIGFSIGVEAATPPPFDYADKINQLHNYMRTGEIRQAWKQSYCKKTIAPP